MRYYYRMLIQEFRPDRVASARREKGLTQKALADSVGISTAMVIGLEKGRKRPSMKTAERLATALGCPINWLFGADLTGGPGPVPETASVVSIMSKLALRVVTGIATQDEKDRLMRLAVQHMDQGADPVLTQICIEAADMGHESSESADFLRKLEMDLESSRL